MRQYLNLAETLLQAWLNHTVLVLALATLKTYFFSTALIAMIAAVSDSSMPLCHQLEALANEMEHAPTQMSRITALVIQTLADNFHTLMKKLVLLVAAVAKGIIALLLELYLGTLTCLLTALVRGVLGLVSDILEEIAGFLQLAISTVLQEFNSALAGLSSVINTVTTAVSAVESLFTSSDSSSLASNVNSVNLTVSSLSNITIPTTWIADIDDLANNIPDFEDVLSNVSSLITYPVMRLGTSFANSSFNFRLNESVLALEATQFIAAKDLVVKQVTAITLEKPDPALGLCDVYESVLSSAMTATKALSDYIVLALCIGIVLYAIMMWVLSYFRMKKRSRLYKTLAGIDNPIEIGNNIALYEQGFMAALTSKWNPEVRWLYAYLSTNNLRMCILVGLLGWLVVLVQFIILNQTAKVLKHVLAENRVYFQSKESIAGKFAQHLGDAQTSLNGAIDEANETLVSSVHNATSTILHEIDSFQASVNDTLNFVFGSSFLASPLRTIIYCTVGRKVEAVEKGLQWLETNTAFEGPSLEISYMEEVFRNSTTDVSALLLRMAEHIVFVVQKIVKTQKKALWTEFFIATAFVVIWVCYFFLGLILLANRKVQTTADPDQRPRSQTISWPSQLCEEGQREYTYPYNDPYGERCAGNKNDRNSVFSDSHTAVPGIANR